MGQKSEQLSPYLPAGHTLPNEKDEALFVFTYSPIILLENITHRKRYKIS